MSKKKNDREPIEEIAQESLTEQQAAEAELAEIAQEEAAAESSAPETVPAAKPARRPNRALQFGAYSVAVIAGFIAVVVVINVLFGILADRISFKTDLTAGKEFSISDENRDYVKKVDKDVTITVCLLETQYADGYFASYVEYTQGVQDSTGGRYYRQAIELLKEYTKLNGKIKLQFIDMTKPESEAVVSAYSTLAPGDFLIERKIDEENTRHKILGFTDLYSVEQDEYAQMYGGAAAISGSKVETAVTSAIYAVVSDKTYNVSVYTGNGCTSTMTGLQELWTQNNYIVNTFDNLLLGNIPEDTDLLVIAAPTSDLEAAALEKVSAFLDNGGKKGKNLLYFAKSGAALPTMNAFLEQWCIQQLDGRLIETTDGRHDPEDTGLFLMYAEESDYLKDLSGQNIQCVAGNNAGFRLLPAKGGIETLDLVGCSDTVVLRPSGAADSWKPADATEKGPFPTVAVATATVYEELEATTSNVIAVSSIDFLTSPYISAGYLNLDVLFYTTDHVVNTSTDKISVMNKTITTDSFMPTGLGANLILWIFVIGVPILILVSGILIWVRRKNL